MNRETMLMHFGRTQTPGPANPPIVRASTVLHDTVQSYRETKAARDTNDRVLSYGRRGTTTAHELSAALCALEEAEACFLFPTGVAAIAGGLMPYLASGDHLLVVDTIFPATRSFCDTVLARYGVEIDYIPWNTTDLSEYVKPNTRLVLTESPASQSYEVMDLPALCKNAHDHGLIVAADNTYGSSWLYRPLQLGCDVSIIAGTKYIGGHADSMMGAVAARGPAVDALRKHTATTGQTISPDDAYACIRGLRTLGLRMERHGENGLALAQWFQGRCEVSQVLHPGLPDHPGAGIWARDASGTNGLLTVDFCDWFDAERFVDHLQLFSIGSSWGGFESLAMPCTPDNGRAFGSDAGARAMIRFHAGLEHVDDLIADLEQSFCNA
ncbi:cystathionine beta-lyase [Roseovarius sp. MMSF_3281]|uniref:cystathionine beta-lyase n=1 Tax=Roseovarius sp. MMSF_3281 TaxID=3046694 RepID=UPI00273F91FC|nr:cystathionine beta-lyase [Roseovarius sp. MMSF_3281]